ncbi:P-selectin-like isoform X3 [Ranitomeya imitator]|uniref:P-selectin-like isoform X3 n=1 Tax=Ranitomeya imitator TaxID=111125 RepID=UPI0037E7528B
MDPIPFQDVGGSIAGKWTYFQLLCLATVSFGFLRVVEVSGWTYHYSTTVQTWNESHNWCKTNFTDMVAIQNKEEISFLTHYLPNDSMHYWIGLRKKNNIWVWIGTNKTLTKNEENWAQGEPNNKRNNQDCVEIYIRRLKESGKWNDERCDRKKRALCYLVSCNDASCNKHGDCMETVENYTCKCWSGFYGANCKNAVQCKVLQSPEHGQVHCSHTFGEYRFKSICNVTCEEGFESQGTTSLLCQNTGEWSESTPSCSAQNVSMENQKQAHTVAYTLTGLGLMLSGTAMAFGIKYYCKKRNAGLLKEDKDEDKTSTFENPAFEDNGI